TTRTGYYLRKYNNWKSGRDNSADGEVRLFRLAELYLNFAESANRSAGPDVAVNLGNGVSMSARDAVNAIRSRAGMPPFPAGMTQDAFEQKYRNERRVELAFEEHRYFDVRRWKILEQSERFLTGMRITQTGAGFSYERIGFERASGIEKYYFYPLDQTEVNKMQDHTGVNWQNPGWN
ncbi:MAG: RagB/SusD family nutrient uptake outer membrane protein, partial [Bacteroidales bacterium]|nr:RagB/SusD family nutrient uptake outer membrane protein [Bacteroidales bacterium]